MANPNNCIPGIRYFSKEVFSPSLLPLSEMLCRVIQNEPILLMNYMNHFMIDIYSLHIQLFSRMKPCMLQVYDESSFFICNILCLAFLSEIFCSTDIFLFDMSLFFVLMMHSIFFLSSRFFHLHAPPIETPKVLSVFSSWHIYLFRLASCVKTHESEPHYPTFCCLQVRGALITPSSLSFHHISSIWAVVLYRAETINKSTYLLGGQKWFKDSQSISGFLFSSSQSSS